MPKGLQFISKVADHLIVEKIF